MAILSGDVFPTFKTEYREDILPAPSLFAFRPDSPHGWGTSTDAPSKRVVVNTSVAPPKSLMEVLQGVPFIQCPLTDPERIWELGTTLRANVLIPDALSRLRISMFVTELSLLILEHYFSEHELQAATKARKISASALQWHYDHLEERPSVSDVAVAMGICESHLRRLFREALGKSPHEIMQEMRISRAKEMLLNTTLSGSEVAYASGFSSVSVFTRTFKQKAGHPPMAYRALVCSE